MPQDSQVKWAQKMEMDSLRRSLNSSSAVLLEAVEEIQRLLDDTEHQDAHSPDARWVDNVARLQKKIISVPSDCGIHRLSQIANGLEKANASA